MLKRLHVSENIPRELGVKSELFQGHRERCKEGDVFIRLVVLFGK